MVDARLPRLWSQSRDRDSGSATRHMPSTQASSHNLTDCQWHDCAGAALPVPRPGQVTPPAARRRLGCPGGRPARKCVEYQVSAFQLRRTLGSSGTIPSSRPGLTRASRRRPSKTVTVNPGPGRLRRPTRGAVRSELSPSQATTESRRPPRLLPGCQRRT